MNKDSELQKETSKAKRSKPRIKRYLDAGSPQAGEALRIPSQAERAPHESDAMPGETLMDGGPAPSRPAQP